MLEKIDPILHGNMLIFRNGHIYPSKESEHGLWVFGLCRGNIKNIPKQPELNFYVQ